MLAGPNKDSSVKLAIIKNRPHFETVTFMQLKIELELCRTGLLYVIWIFVGRSNIPFGCNRIWYISYKRNWPTFTKHEHLQEPIM